MPKITVYLPDDLHERVKASHLNVSQVTQDALRRALDDSPMANWLASLDLDEDRPRVSSAEVQAALRAEREANG